MVLVPKLNESIAELLKKLEVEDKVLKSRMEDVIKIAYKKAYKKDEELEQIEFLSKDMIEQLNEDIAEINRKVQIVQGRMEKLFECLIKSNLENETYPQV